MMKEMKMREMKKEENNRYLYSEGESHDCAEQRCEIYLRKREREEEEERREREEERETYSNTRLASFVRTIREEE